MQHADGRQVATAVRAVRFWWRNCCCAPTNRRVLDDRLTAKLVAIVTFGVATAVQVSIVMYAWKVLPDARRVSFVVISFIMAAPIFGFAIHAFRKAGRLP